MTNLIDEELVENLTQTIGKRLFCLVREEARSVFKSYYWKQWLMRRIGRDDDFRMQVLRFIDVFPNLETEEARFRHFREYFLKEVDKASLLKYLFFLVSNVQKIPLGSRTRDLLMRLAVKHLASQFIVDPQKLGRMLKSLSKEGALFSVDILGEAVISEKEADDYYKKYLNLFELFRSLDFKEREVSCKLSSLYSQFDPIDPQGSAEAVKKRLRILLRAAKKDNIGLTIDMEHFWYRDLIFKIFQEIFSEKEFRDFENAGIAFQTYLLDSLDCLKTFVAWIEKLARFPINPIKIRLVKGAYWDYEVITALQKHWPTPVFTQKWETDLVCEEAIKFLLLKQKGGLPVRTAFAGHNIRTIARTMALAEILEISPNEIELQLLRGVGEPILKKPILRMGYPTRIYVPVGDLIPGMGYLVRRIIENSSQTSFVFQDFLKIPLERLLENPRVLTENFE